MGTTSTDMRFVEGLPANAEEASSAVRSSFRIGGPRLSLRS